MYSFIAHSKKVSFFLQIKSIRAYEEWLGNKIIQENIQLFRLLCWKSHFNMIYKISSLAKHILLSQASKKQKRKEGRHGAMVIMRNDIQHNKMIFNEGGKLDKYINTKYISSFVHCITTYKLLLPSLLPP